MKNFFDIIQDYLDGTLDAAEAQSFEQALQTDKALADELAFYQDMVKGIEFGADYSLRNTLKNVQMGLKNEGFFLTNNDINLYIDGDLDSTKLDGFQFRLAHDTAFATEVALQKDLIKGIEIGADTNLRNTIQQAQQNYFEEKTPIIRSLNTVTPSRDEAEGIKGGQAKVRKIGFQWWAAAASIVLLITVSIWYLSPSKSKTYDDISAQYFQAENQRVKDIYAELSADGFAADKLRNSSLKNALEAYQKQDYPVAKILLERHLGQFTTDFDAQFYLSMIYVSLNDKEKAIPVLETLLKNKTLWVNEAEWHLALIYWNMPEKHSVAVAYLTNIAENNNAAYQAKAKEILLKN